MDTEDTEDTEEQDFGTCSYCLISLCYCGCCHICDNGSIFETQDGE